MRWSMATQWAGSRSRGPALARCRFRRDPVRPLAAAASAALLVATVFAGGATRASDAPSGGRADGSPKAEDPVLAVVDATIYPVHRAPIRRGTIVWRGREILSVGVETEVPAGAKVIDGTGLSVCPGFIAVEATGLGLESTQGDLAHGLDPWDLELRIALAHGITTAHVRAGSSSAIVKLTHGDLEGMLVREPVFHTLSLPSRQPIREAHDLRDRLRRAREFIEKEAEAKRKKAEAPKMPRDLGAWVAILRKDRPCLVSAADRWQIDLALDLKREYGVELVLLHPEGATGVATELAASGVPVVVKTRGRDFDFGLSTPILDDDDLVPVRRAARLAEAGCTVAIAPYKTSVSLMGLAGRDLTALSMDAAFAVRGGLSEAEALAGITIEAARVLGLDDRIGSLEPGKDADLLLLDGDPLDYRTRVSRAFIGGKERYARARSRLFGERDD